MRVKVGDTVKVITGDDRGVTAKVLRVDHDKNKLVVEGVNRVYKHVKRSQKNPQGGRLAREMPISASNVQLVCPTTGVATRVGVVFQGDGSKVRYCKKSKQTAGVIMPPKPARLAKSTKK